MKKNVLMKVYFLFSSSFMCAREAMNVSVRLYLQILTLWRVMNEKIESWTKEKTTTIRITDEIGSTKTISPRLLKCSELLGFIDRVGPSRVRVI